MTLNDDKDEFENHPLLPIQRKQHIIDFLHRHGAVTLQQLANALHVSLSTLRRDLETLSAEGLVDRTHGGALLRHQSYNTFEPDFSAARELSATEKGLIGMKAAMGLLTGQSVIFDSGSTLMETAKMVVARKIKILAVTNDIQIAQILGASPLIRVQVFGGQLRSGSNTLIGDGVLSAVRSIRADVLLMGAHAVTENIVTETSPDVVAIKKAYIGAANSRRLLVDSTKFRPRVFMHVCDISEMDEIITDENIPADEPKRIRSLGIKLSIADKAMENLIG